jgi:Zn-dependent protease
MTQSNVLEQAFFCLDCLTRRGCQGQAPLLVFFRLRRLLFGSDGTSKKPWGIAQLLKLFNVMCDKIVQTEMLAQPELRQMMRWNSDEFSEYTQASNESDYSNPAYYRQDGSKAPRSAQPVQPLNAYPDYLQDAPGDNGYAPDLMSEYRGPASMENYTTDAGAEQRDAAERGKVEGSGKRKGLAGLGGIGAALAALLKLQWLAVFAKFGIASFSAIVSVVLYSFLFGWPFAIGLVVLLFIHEMGHAIVMKLKGLPVGGMIFIPMLGAAVLMRQMPKNAKDEAEVGIAGPIAGALAASVCLLLALQAPYTHSIWAPLAYFGFFINLFNLIPIVPFDGGRVLAAIDRRVWIVGFLGLVAFLIWSWINGNFSPWLLLFVVMAGTQFWARRSAPNTPETKAYYTVPLGERIVLGVLYFGLAAVLVLGMSISRGLIIPLG